MRMISRILIFTAALLCCGQAQAGMSTEEVIATGTGSNHNEAIYRALTEAVSQVSGVVIDSKNSLIMSHRFSSDEEKNTDIFNENLKVNTNSRINGVVDRYDVLSEDCDNGKCEVELSVRVKKYTSPGPSNEGRRRIAVMPFEVLSLSGCTERANKLLASEISSQLTASRRFAVLDRGEISSYESEKGMILSDDVQNAERAKLGQVLGTDYILTGTIRDISTKNSGTINPVTGGLITENYSGQLIMDFKVSVFATRQVKFSSTVSVKVESSDKSCAEVVNELVKKSAFQVVDKLIDDIFPLTVVKVDTAKGFVYLNMGGDKLQVGDRYSVNSLGEELFDPYTGESLGSEEDTVGYIEIIEVKPKFSIGKVSDGKISGIKNGHICRRVP